ncbi:MAG: saccharopine dehydrogenase C-terminal domain-containing protein [bacterium]
MKTNKSIYAVIGCGMQGVAEAYDLVRFGHAEKVVMVDLRREAAEQAAASVNMLTESDRAVSIAIDASRGDDIVRMLRDHNVTVCCGAAHYALNYELSKAALEAGAHFCDMGGNTEVVMKQHLLHDPAMQKNIGIVPDCGIAPGTANILAARAIKHIECDSIQMYCGGLPVSRDLPLGYKLVFSISGLTNEYTGNCIEIRDGRIVSVPAFTEKEALVLPEPVGACEAFLTSGGTSTGPISFHGKLSSYGYKTVRYPGHYATVRSMIDMGLLELDPVQVAGQDVVPRDLFHVLASAYWDYPDEPDLLVLRVVAKGAIDGRPVTMIQDLMDIQDGKTGFSAMARTTAFSAAIIAEALASGVLGSGVHYLERSVDPDWFVEEMAKRSLHVVTLIESAG